MSQNQSLSSTKKKFITYALCVALAITTALIAVILILTLLKNPPNFFNENYIPNNSKFSSSSNYSDFSNSSTISNLLNQNTQQNQNTTPNQNDVYVPEAATTLTEEGSQQNVDKIVDAAQNIKPDQKHKVIVKNYKVDRTIFTKKQVKIPVNYLAQNPELPSGSEITALTTVINYYGCNITKTEMASKYLAKSENKIGDFWEVFVGDPTKNGFGCYAKPIVNAANNYFQQTGTSLIAKDFSGAKFEELLLLLEKDVPVIIWSTTYDEATNTLSEPYSTIKWSIDGKDLQWIAPEHCMVLIGYDVDRSVAIVSDPQRGIVEYDLDTVKARYMALHSQCVVIEELPMVSGVQNGETYYTTQCVTVSPRNLASISLNGRKIHDTVFLIDGNRNETYRILVTNQSGNTTEIVVYTRDITDLMEPLQGITEANATADHKELIQSVLKKIQSCDTRYNSASETQTLNDMTTNCNLMLENIDKAAKELSRLKKEIEKYENKELTSNDNEDLTKLLDDIMALRASSNATNIQKNELAKMQTKCQKWVNKTIIK